MNYEVTLDNLIGFFEKIKGFQDLDRKDMEEFIAPVVCVTLFEPGQFLMKKGDVGHSLYFIYEGRARVDRVASGENRHFFVEKGAILGEMALVSREVRSADVVAETQVVCLTIDIETFHTVMADHWTIAKAVAGLIGRRRIDKLSTSSKTG